MTNPDLPADRVEAKQRINEGEQPTTPAPAEPTPVQATDPADDFHGPDAVPGDRDDVDVPLAELQTTQDGPGETDPGKPDFQGYADPSADTQEDNS